MTCLRQITRKEQSWVVTSLTKDSLCHRACGTKEQTSGLGPELHTSTCSQCHGGIRKEQQREPEWQWEQEGNKQKNLMGSEVGGQGQVPLVRCFTIPTFPRRFSTWWYFLRDSGSSFTEEGRIFLCAKHFPKHLTYIMHWTLTMLQWLKIFLSLVLKIMLFKCTSWTGGRLRTSLQSTQQDEKFRVGI